MEDIVDVCEDEMGSLWFVSMGLSGISSSQGRSPGVRVVSWAQLSLWFSEHKLLCKESRCVVRITQPHYGSWGRVLELCE